MCASREDPTYTESRASFVAFGVLAENEWSELLTAEDRRGPTSLFWQHVLPYSEVKLDITARLNIPTSV